MKGLIKGKLKKYLICSKRNIKWMEDTVKRQFQG